MLAYTIYCCVIVIDFLAIEMYIDTITINSFVAIATIVVIQINIITVVLNIEAYLLDS